MAARKMTVSERRAAEAMVRGRLTRGDRKSTVVSAARAWLVHCGWTVSAALATARKIVEKIENEIAAPVKSVPLESALYEAWRLPGSDWVEGEISPSEAKSIGATIKIKGLAREFHLKFESRWGDDLFPWKLRENQPVGTLGAVDDFVSVGEFSTMTAARAEARMLARSTR
jgi:hypothetical protein